MADNGVLNSWETFSTKSVRRISVPANSFAIRLKLCAISRSSLIRIFSSRTTSKFPFATSWVATVNTVEGNSGDKVARHSYVIGDDRIYGYGVVDY